ncbi:MAG: hypothetical protein HPY64_04720 [Anaerolineae bacterium]|nr:hypothetical protein [Anaerolineae bacterium]
MSIMRPPAWLRFLSANLSWLAASLLLAMFVWIAATIQQNPVEARRFPERLPIQILTDEGMIVTNNPITSAQVVLRAQADVWAVLEAQDIVVTADLRGKPPGTYTVDLNITFTTFSRIVLEDWLPRQVTVSIDRAAEILVPINADIRSGPQTGFEITAITFGAQEARVTGPASQVERVVSADVRLNLADERNPFTRNYRLYAMDAQGQTVPGVTLIPDNTDVTIDIQPQENFREVFVTPNIIGEPASGYVVFAITYEPQTVLISGRPGALEQITGTIQTAPIDLTGQTASFSRTVPLELPAGVFLPIEQNVTVSVVIDTLPASRRFEHLPVQVQGLDPNANLEALIMPTEVTMLITGPQPILDTLTPADITIVADLTGLAPGGHQVPLQAIVSRDGLQSANISVLPPVLDVQITAQKPTAETPAPEVMPATPTAAP